MKSIPGIYSKLILSMLLAFSLISCNSWDYPRERKVKRVVLPASEVHEGWYFAAGDQVVIEGTVNGDAYVAGGLVEVDGTINGDLLVAGGQVSVSGTVSDNIRAAGGNLQFNGKVGKNISAAGGRITVGKPAEIRGGLLAACGNLEVAGTIARETRVAAGDMGVSGTINGNVNFTGGYLSVLPGAKISGNLSARVKEKEHVEITQGTVRGTATIDTREIKHIIGFRPRYFWFKIFWAFSLLVTGLLLAFAFPKQLIGIGSNITQNPLHTLLWGIVGLIVLPIVMVLLSVTIVGIPLGLFLLVMFLWIVYLSQLSLGAVLGDRLFGMEGKTGWNLFWAFAIGLLIVQALTFVPYLRPLVIIAGLVFGFGAILLVLKSELQLRRGT